MSKTKECLFVLDLLDAEKINVLEAERLISAMQPQRRGRGVTREPHMSDAISVIVDGTQANLGEVMHKLTAALEQAVPIEVN